MRPLALCLVLAAAIALLAGCGGKSKSEKAQDAVCGAKSDISGAVTDLQSLTPSTFSVDTVQSDVKTIQDGIATIADNVGDLDSGKKSEIQSANQTFKTQVQSIISGLTSNLTPSNARQQLQQALTQLTAAYKATIQPIDCSS